MKVFDPASPAFLDNLRELIKISDEINDSYIDNNLISHFLNQMSNSEPETDISQTKTEVVIKIQVPGLKKDDDINITIKGNILYIQGSYKRNNSVFETQSFSGTERNGSFSKVIPLPAVVRPESAQAAYKEGSLEIILQKDHNVRDTSVEVEFF